MMTTYSLNKNTLYLWSACLKDFIEQEASFFKMLSMDEVQRAERFRFPLHRCRFILSRGILRKILSLYTGQLPGEIVFEYGVRGKPFLRDNPLDLQFNVSHSEDMVLYGITQGGEIGVDIQKMETKNYEAIAKRFFSSEENQQLLQLSAEKRGDAFFQLWVSKEALIKVMGEGLHVPLHDFSVNLKEKSQWVDLSYQGQSFTFYLENFNIRSDYQAAFASQQQLTKTCLLYPISTSVK